MSILTTCKVCGLQSYVDGVQRHMADCKTLRPDYVGSREPTEMEMRCAMKVCCGPEINVVCKRSAGLCDARDYLPMVRRVIREMREPTDDMMQAAFDASGLPNKDAYDLRGALMASVIAASPEIAP